jgi:hypothetical protein
MAFAVDPVGSFEVRHGRAAGVVVGVSPAHLVRPVLVQVIAILEPAPLVGGGVCVGRDACCDEDEACNGCCDSGSDPMHELPPSVGAIEPQAGCGLRVLFLISHEEALSG